MRAKDAQQKGQKKKKLKRQRYRTVHRYQNTTRVLERRKKTEDRKSKKLIEKYSPNWRTKFAESNVSTSTQHSGQKCTPRHNTGDKEKIIKGHKLRKNKKKVSYRGYQESEWLQARQQIENQKTIEKCVQNSKKLLNIEFSIELNNRFWKRLKKFSNIQSVNKFAFHALE